MDEDYIVNFVKDREYKRFHVTGVLSNYNKNMFTIDMFEETIPLMTQFKFDSEGKATSENEEGNLKNYIYATAIIAPENIPLIINSLQSLYDRYKEGKLSGEEP